MGSYWLNVAISKVVIPVTFAACTIWRPTGLSLVYLGLMLYSPMSPIPTSATMSGHTGRYLQSCMALTFLTALTQFTFHIVLLALPPYGYFLEACTFLEELFRHLGLVRMDGASAWEVFFWLLPEIVSLPISIASYLVCKRLTWEAPREDDESSIQRTTKKVHEDGKNKIINVIGTLGTYVVLASLCCVSSLTPSIEGAFYFIIFIGAATWWACHRELLKGFAVICRIVMAVVVVHILVIMAYQNQWPQEFVTVNSTWARYFALEPYYTSNCSDPRYVDYVGDSEWSSYSHALGLFWLYYVLAMQSQFLFRKPAINDPTLSGRLKDLDTPLSRHVSIKRRSPSQRWQSARRKARKPIVPATSPVDERTPLMRFGSGRTALLQDSTGSVIVQDGHQDDSIPMHSLSEEETPGIVEHVIMAVYSIFQLIVSSSYLATNIMMMTWSIMYHSWTTFALLMWALILWMVPNKRSSMMKCSPFIVFYSTLLILVGYVYSMNLTEEELPTVFYGVKMFEIGFGKPDQLSSWHQIVKCAFMSMFWVTMRQYMAERQNQRRSSAIRDMVAPLHVSVSTATTTMNQQTPEIKSKFMKDVGRVVKKLLAKFWIAVVAIMLFTSGITGERMTVFRIIYMSLFLFFVISFQISWTVWRKMMYGFWITVIGYSVVMLILVYTYQFENFPRYWNETLHINKDLQMDIGLESYETKDLFVRLLTPTFFVIITVLQIHYFHDDFLEVTNLDKVGLSEVSKRGSLGRSSSVVPTASPLDVLLTENEEKPTVYTLKQLKHMSKLERIALFRKVVNHLKDFYNYVWLILEIHIQKIVFIAFMLLCINDVCAINLFFVIAVVVAINFRRSMQIMTINVMAGIIALLMVTKMLYQIKYNPHEDWNVNCTREVGNETVTAVYNIFEWIGMKKVSPGQLPDLLKGYIGIVIVTTIRAIIMVRQCFYRHGRGEALETPSVMFPGIARSDADKGIPECLKFLFNYGFYKFGVETTLMAVVALIGTRLDFYSVLYGIWLLVLFSLKRTIIARIWPFFRTFAIVALPVQYAFVVAPPTWLCIDYPWSLNGTLRRLQEWMYFPDPDYPPNPKKLICDFIILLMIVRQSLVFRIEARTRSTGEAFIAGHNYSVVQEMDKPNFVNPVKDYVSNITCWLDVVKRGTMMSLMWITLSIMFLAGTKRTNIFSLGYLIGAFIFLWHGSDFYLRPMKTIIKWWNLLIGYNVVVIVAKALLQGVGCVLILDEKQVCWAIQLLGIACLKKFRSSSTDILLPDECEVPREDIGMVWDGLCFGFLLISKRLFKSYYFFHIVDETKAMSILASRGAELLEDLHRKRIELQENVEKTVLQKLKFKMDKIKADQQRIQGPSYREPTDHKIGEAPLARASSVSSCVSSGHTPDQGYRTPIDEDEDDDEDEENEEFDGNLPPLTPRAASMLQAPSPNSAILTVSLDGYLEPTRISFGSPPSSDLNPRGPSPDETFPVFSPPPYEQTSPNHRASFSSRSLHRHRRQSSFMSGPWPSEGLRTPRTSIISTTSRSIRSHHTYSLYPRDRPLYKHRVPKTNREAVRSGDYYMFDDLDDDDVTDLMPDLTEQREDEERRKLQSKKGRRMTVAELMTTLLKTDIEITTHVAMYGGTQKDAIRLRRQSVPLTRKKSSMSYLSARSETDTAAPTDGQDETSLESTEVDEIEREIKTEDLAKSPEPSDEGEDLTEDPIGDIEGPKEDEEKKKISLLTYFKFIFVIINSTMVSMTRYLNRFSRDYRYIRKVLSKEKRILKAKPDFRMGTRLGINQIWQPKPIMKQRSETEECNPETPDPGEGTSKIRNSRERRKILASWVKKRLRRSVTFTTKSHTKESSLTLPHIRILAPSLERGLDVSSSSSISSQTKATDQPEEDPERSGELSEVDQPPIIQLAASIWFGILAHSTFLCYFFVFLHQIKNASVISTPLPLMVFFWGSLTIPRPSKTFWVTLIAYTEIIVIVKCIFQLELLPWNKYPEPLSRPLAPARIIGLERQVNYALWDLLLLLVVFFHRFMLKSLGQWTTPVKLRKIIPSKMTIATMRNGDGDETGEPTRFHWQNEETNNKTDLDRTPKEQSLPDESESPKGDVTDSQERLVAIKGDETNVCNENLKTAMNMTAQKYAEPAKAFFQNILSSEGKERTNVYAYMFLCDFFNFILIIFGFSAFGTQQGDGGVTAYLSENRVPMPFLLMLLLQFGLIVIDRALFLRKSILGKLIFQYFLVFGVHIWMFFALPSITERQFNDKLPPQIWYMMKCFYLLLAAYQLRLGYPTRILGNFLCKNYSLVNYGLFKGFMFVPFLFELRAVMDWIWTDTSMTVMDWFKMEDIFASIYQLKCMRGVETDYPQPRGVKKAQMSKYITGGGFLFVMIGLIWFPLLLFALGSTVGGPNLPNEVSMKIRIGPYEPIYGMSAQESSIYKYTEQDFEALKSVYSHNRPALTFLENYANTDVAAVRLSSESRRIWGISPPDRKRLIEELKSNNTVTVHVEWTVNRKTDVKDFNGITTKGRDIKLPAWENGEFNPVRTSLADLLLANNETTAGNGTILLKNAFPKFLKVTSRTTDPVTQLMKTIPYDNPYEEDDERHEDFKYRNVSLQLYTNLDCCAHQQWWIVTEKCNDNFWDQTLRKIPLNDCSHIMMFLFNDKAFPEGLSFISGFGILGLYTTAVIVISQVIRRLVSEMAPKIMFDDLPYVDRILRLCLDIYLVRESGDLCLEEDLFAKLIFLYRSPETLIRWTRPPEPGSRGNRQSDDDEEDVDRPDESEIRNA